MSNTPSTNIALAGDVSVQKAAVTAATKPIALLAIAHHVETHKLLVPDTIAFEPGETRVRLFLESFGSQRWIDSVAIDEQHDELVRPGWVRTTIDARLPDLGIKVQLRFLREAPAFVVVPS